MKKVMFICTGNTCRSAMAQAIFNSRAVEKNLDIIATSAGVSAFGGDLASFNAIAVLHAIDIDLKGHRSSALTKYHLDETGHFYCMTEGHKGVLLSLGVDENCITVLDVSDPFGASLEAYMACRDEIAAKIDEILNDITVMPLAASDLSKAAGLAAKCIGEGFGDSTLKSQLENEQYIMRSAFICGELVGFAVVKIVDDYAEILAIVVNEKQRNAGVGSALLAEILADCKAGTVSLEVRGGNTAAINLYKKFGFEQSGIRKDFYKNPPENAVVLVKNLEDGE